MSFMIFILLISVSIFAADNTDNTQELAWLKGQQITLQNSLRRLDLEKRWANIKRLEEESSDDETISSKSTPDTAADQERTNKENKIKHQLSVIEAKIATLQPVHIVAKNNNSWLAWLFTDKKPTTPEELAKIREKNQQLEAQLARKEKRIDALLEIETNDDGKIKND
jgi:hypothetical protein